MNENAERRKFPRVKTHIPVRYKKLQSGADIEEASSVSKNLSQGGIRFRTQEFVSMACRLILELDIPMFSKPIKAISKIAWIRKTDSGDEYEVGNQFLEMSKQDKVLVSEYVDSLEMYNSPEDASGEKETLETKSED